MARDFGLPSRSVHVVSGSDRFDAGHWIMEERPHEVAALLADFVG